MGWLDSYKYTYISPARQQSQRQREQFGFSAIDSGVFKMGWTEEWACPPLGIHHRACGVVPADEHSVGEVLRIAWAVAIELLVRVVWQRGWNEKREIVL